EECEREMHVVRTDPSQAAAKAAVSFADFLLDTILLSRDRLSRFVVQFYRDEETHGCLNWGIGNWGIELTDWMIARPPGDSFIGVRSTSDEAGSWQLASPET